MPEPEAFCKYVAEQIVDEKHAGALYDHVLETIDAMPAMAPFNRELLKALVQKIAMDEKSHLFVLQVIDRTVCGGSS